MTQSFENFLKDVLRTDEPESSEDTEMFNSEFASWLDYMDKELLFLYAEKWHSMGLVHHTDYLIKELNIK